MSNAWGSMNEIMDKIPRKLLKIIGMHQLATKSWPQNRLLSLEYQSYFGSGWG